MDRITAFLFFMIGVSFIFIDEYNFRGVTLKTDDYPIFKLFGLLLALFCLYLLFKIKKIAKNENIKEIEYTKCPTCKETFTYNELEKGKCKNCKDVDTIELEEYYEKYPEEKDNKNQ
ncbi:MAG: hypothetical protein ACNI28_02285 [Arcobacter sp.]|uniref:hypothetical protein n=1 Tax=Arcobacter sp. TaxID=1872629 RepID=UPI003AFFB65E